MKRKAENVLGESAKKSKIDIKQEVKDSPESKLLKDVIKISSDSRKYVEYKSVISQYLNPASTFIKDLVNICKNPQFWPFNKSFYLGDLLDISNDGEYFLTRKHNDLAVEIFKSEIKNLEMQLGLVSKFSLKKDEAKFSNDANYVLFVEDSSSNSAYKSVIKLYNIKDKQNPIQMNKAEEPFYLGSFSPIAFSPNDKYLAFNEEYRFFIKSLDGLKSGNADLITENKFPGLITSMSFSYDNEYLVLGNEDENLYFYNLKDRKLINHIVTHDNIKADKLHAICCAPSEPYVVAVCAYETEIRLNIWEFNSQGKINLKFNNKLYDWKFDEGEYNEASFSSSFSKDGKYIVVNHAGQIVLVDFSDKNNPKIIFQSLLNSVYENGGRCKFTKDNEYVIAEKYEADSSKFYVYDFRYLKLAKQLHGMLYQNVPVKDKDRVGIIKQLSKNEPTVNIGVLIYMLLKSVLEHRKSQANLPKVEPFLISDHLTVFLFNNLPEVLKENLIKQNYVSWFSKNKLPVLK